MATRCHQAGEQAAVARVDSGIWTGSRGCAVSGKKCCSGADVSHRAQFCGLPRWSQPSDQMLRTCRDAGEELPQGVWHCIHSWQLEMWEAPGAVFIWVGDWEAPCVSAWSFCMGWRIGYQRALIVPWTQQDVRLGRWKIRKTQIGNETRRS